MILENKLTVVNKLFSREISDNLVCKFC